MSEEWYEDMVQQMQDKKGLTEDQSHYAVSLFRKEYIGQNAHALWQHCINEAIKTL